MYEMNNDSLNMRSKCRFEHTNNHHFEDLSFIHTVSKNYMMLLANKNVLQSSFNYHQDFLLLAQYPTMSMTKFQQYLKFFERNPDASCAHFKHFVVVFEPQTLKHPTK